MSGKYPLELIFDSEGRKITDPSDLKPMLMMIVYTTGVSPVHNIDMAVPRMYIFSFGHTGTTKLNLLNVSSQTCVTVNIKILATELRLFEVCNDKGTVIGSNQWMEGIVLDSIAAFKTYLVSIKNYGEGINSVLINWIKVG